LVWHRVFRPSPQDPLDFEVAIEQTLFELRDRFHLRQVYFDPYQLVSVAQRLRHRGLPMVEFTQTVSNLTEASSNLYELIKGCNLWVYQDPDMRLAVSRAVALETSRGWRITKEKTNHKIDVVVSLAMAALGAVRGGQPAEPSHLTYLKQVLARMNGEDAALPSSDPTRGMRRCRKATRQEQPERRGRQSTTPPKARWRASSSLAAAGRLPRTTK
jgi:hypothetical protein